MLTKKELRKQVIAARDAIDPALREKKARAAIARVLEYPAFVNARVVFAYKAFGSELDLSALIDHPLSADKLFAYPVCDGRGHMCAAAGNRWQTDRYGILEPDLAYARIVTPSEIDLVLVPGVAFDRGGCRLGYGAGYYDRFLPLCGNAARLGMAFDEQIVESALACEHDCTMHAVVTDREAIVGR